jgi:hypothetical protein
VRDQPQQGDKKIANQQMLQSKQAFENRKDANKSLDTSNIREANKHQFTRNRKDAIKSWDKCNSRIENLL